MFDLIFHRLIRHDALRRAQWFFKTEPSRFMALTQGGPVCPACAHPATHSSDYPSRHRLFADKPVFYCAYCGLGFVMNMAPVLAQYYQHEYARSNRGDRNEDPAQYFRDMEAEDDAGLIKYRNRAKRQMFLLEENGARFGRVLDYGSGPGYFLQACGTKDAHAVEPDVLSHKYLSHLGARIHTDVSTLPQGAFDTIVASHAIEHLPAEALGSTLAALVGALAPQGRLLIEVPQGGHSYLHLAGQRQDPHTLFFTGQALVEAMRAAGAAVLFQQALGRVISPLRRDALYAAEGPPFYKTQRGSLTLICRAA